MKNPVVNLKALKQKVTMMTLPKYFCETLEIKPGDDLELTLNYEKECIEVRKKH